MPQAPLPSFGITTAPMQVSYQDILRVWREADAIREIEHAWLFDHLMPIAGDPDGPIFEGWTLLSALAAQTERLRLGLLVTSNRFRPPAMLAKIATTVDIVSGGRLVFGIGAGSRPSHPLARREYEAHGLPYHDFRHSVEDLAEACTVIRRLWTETEPFDFHGEHYQVEGATVLRPPEPVPGVYFGGSSAAAGQVAASSADVYLTWGEPPAQVAEKLTWIRELAAAQGRTLRFGIRLHVITRDTEADAWTEASRLLDYIDPAEIAKAQQVLGASESVGQDRMRALHSAYRHGGSAQDLEIYPNLWSGVGLVRGGAGTALVGSHEKVADLIEEYASLGISEFILSGYPHLEEAYWFGEGVLPEIRRREAAAANSGRPHLRASA